jgi:hypothetical protein
MTIPGPDSSYEDKIKWILEGHEDLIKSISQEPHTSKLEQDVAKVKLENKDKEVSLEEQIRQAFFYTGGLEVVHRQSEKELEKTPEKTEQDASPSS